MAAARRVVKEAVERSTNFLSWKLGETVRLGDAWGRGSVALMTASDSGRDRARVACGV
jgi:hypothetical protein